MTAAKPARPKAAPKLAPVEAPPEEISPEEQAVLIEEQRRLNEAVSQAQIAYLSNRVSELSRELAQYKK